MSFGGEAAVIGSRRLFAIHLFTATGAALALLSVLAAWQGDWRATFVWLGIALIVDGIDGPIARRFKVRERLPKWDGAALDFVIDYATYVFIPALVIALGLHLSTLLGAVLGVIVAVTGALYFADTRMKQPDNSFRGFPAVWNMAAFVMFALMPSPAVITIVVIALAALTFLPVNFVHPVRVVRWRPLTLAMLAGWLVASSWFLLTEPPLSAGIKTLLIVTSLYLLCVSGVQQMLPRRPKAGF
ncbi:phosphatidylcholine synthase [Rhizobiales bacterium L72]|uniref:Phosphatidylcholine synthase n=1 Tax=Propylenella binzhouense TaxID=2555902 RepID=A0A964T790_9HYPH|nr:phosphatidylcholine synthase [Propylenella binzhouense]